MDESAHAAVSTRALRFGYGDAEILRGIDLSLAPGETLALLGPSGCGKTTLLRLVAGLLSPTAGEILFERKPVAAPGVFVPPERRGLGMVFQDYALWPHLSVAGNVAFPLEMQRVGRAERERRVAEALRRVGLDHLSARSPATLSGGQQQRVAIARAIVSEPRLVLFDEPLSNLDRELRETMVGELAGLIRALGLTAIYVTHDQAEAFALADRVAIMDRGAVAQIDAPDRLVEEPASVKIAEFLRLGAVGTAHRTAAGWSLCGAALALAGSAPDLPPGVSASVLIPPRALRIVPPGGAGIPGTVGPVQYRDGVFVAGVALDLPGGPFRVQVTNTTRMRTGERLGLEILPDHLRWFPADEPTTP